MYEDDYKLGYTPQFDIDTESKQATLELEPFSESGKYGISGIVKDTANQTIEAATILVLLDNNTILTTYSNSNGEYSVLAPVGTHVVIGGKDGYLTSQRYEVTVAEDVPVTQNITLTANTEINKNIAYGIIKGINNAPVNDATVSVFDSNNQLITFTKSIVDGEYVVNNIINAGEYIFTVTKGGYLVKNIPVTIVQGQPKLQNITLDIDPDAGELAFLLTVKEENTHYPLQGAWAGLYNDEETLLQVFYYKFGWRCTIY